MRNKPTCISKKQAVRSDALFWTIINKRLPNKKRVLLKLEKHTEFVRTEGAGHILRVMKTMKAVKRGMYYTPSGYRNEVYRNNALVNIILKPGTLIFLYADTHSRGLKLRSNAATIISIKDLQNPTKELGFAVSHHAKDSTNEQTAYVPGKSLHITMRGFKDACGAGFHFYSFLSEVNAIWKN